jgi:hypothetical protein
MEIREMREIKLALLFEKKYLFAINKDRFTGKRIIILQMEFRQMAE